MHLRDYVAEQELYVLLTQCVENWNLRRFCSRTLCGVVILTKHICALMKTHPASHSASASQRLPCQQPQHRSPAGRRRLPIRMLHVGRSQVDRLEWALRLGRRTFRCAANPSAFVYKLYTHRLATCTTMNEILARTVSAFCFQLPMHIHYSATWRKVL